MWEKSHNEPLAYTSEDRRWGLVRGKGQWSLHFLSNGKSLREVDTIVAEGDDPPFEEANAKIEDYKKLRNASSWSEAMVGERTPGEEGFAGGTPIPLQTQGPGRAGRTR